MNYLKSLPDKAFDLAIMDPPYGLNIGKYKTMGKGSAAKTNCFTFFKKGNWDNDIPSREYFDELFRVSKNQIIWGANYFSGIVDFSSFSWLVWKKLHINEGLSFSMGELAVYSGKKKLMIFECFHDGNMFSTNPRLAKARAKIHQCQKPVKLYKWLLKSYAENGCSVLDTHLGSGSICLACHDGGFKLTGIELDPDYYAGARQRLINYQAQGNLNFANPQSTPKHI